MSLSTKIKTITDVKKQLKKNENLDLKLIASLLNEFQYSLEKELVKIRLTPSAYPKAKQQFLDQDYIEKLNEDERAFLAKFNAEYVSGTVTEVKPLHRTKKLKKKIYDANNSRNRDLLNKIQTDQIFEDTLEINSFEDDVICHLDIEAILASNLTPTQKDKAIRAYLTKKDEK